MSTSGDKRPYWEIEELNKKKQKDAEMQKFLEQAMQDVMNVKKAVNKPLGESLSDKIEELETRLGRLKEAKKELDGLEIKEGDAAFHKDFGNVIVRRFFVGDATAVIAVKKEYEGKIMAETVGLHGSASVCADELVPITEATKVLFGKK